MAVDEKKTLLIADDEPECRSLIRYLAEGSGWEVVECANGIELTEAIETHPNPSLVILDLMMPKMDGFESLDWMAKKDVDCPVCVISGGKLERKKFGNKMISDSQPQIRDMMRKPLHLKDLRQVLDFIDF